MARNGEEHDINAQVPRLGDLIDDYCPRCKHLFNHDIASLVEGKVVKVICRTCFTEHPFLHGKLPQKKSSTPRGTPFEQVLAKVAPSSDPATTASQKKKRAGPARYISRKKSEPPARGK